MNWSIMSAVASTFTLIVVVVKFAHMTGKYVERADQQDETIDSQTVEIKEIQGHLVKVDIALVRLEEWKNGFTAAVDLMTPERSKQ